VQAGEGKIFGGKDFQTQQLGVFDMMLANYYIPMVGHHFLSSGKERIVDDYLYPGPGKAPPRDEDQYPMNARGVTALRVHPVDGTVACAHASALLRMHLPELPGTMSTTDTMSTTGTTGTTGKATATATFTPTVSGTGTRVMSRFTQLKAKTGILDFIKKLTFYKKRHIKKQAWKKIKGTWKKEIGLIGKEKKDRKEKLEKKKTIVK
jgi:hypothetical protein